MSLEFYRNIKISNNLLSFNLFIFWKLTSHWRHSIVMLAQLFLLLQYMKKCLYIQLTVEAKVICQSFRWRHEPRGRSERYHSRQTSEIREISFPPDIWNQRDIIPARHLKPERYHSFGIPPDIWNHRDFIPAIHLKSKRYHSRQTSEIREISILASRHLKSERFCSRQTSEIREISLQPDILNQRDIIISLQTSEKYQSRQTF